MKKYKGNAPAVLFPKTTDQVSSILKYCNKQSIAIVPQGGNTGLVGGAVGVYDEVVLNMSKMNHIHSFDKVSGVLTCDSGCILEALDTYTRERGYIMPLDLGAKGSCHIGGNVATNAGGLRFLRYGSLHGNVLGLQMVLADGTILDNLNTLSKDNTGYDVKQLFIGSEGTLGIITGVSIKTPKLPSAVNVAVFGVESYEAVQAAFSDAKDHLAEILSAFEFWDEAAFQLVMKHSGHLARNPFDQHYPFYVLVETQGSNQQHDDEKLSTLIQHLMDTNTIQDGVLAQDATQSKQFWNLRETIAESCGKAGAVYKYDLSMPVNKLYDLVVDMRIRLAQHGLYSKEDEGDLAVKQVVGYGHIGDGNLHLNITAKEYAPTVTDVIEPFVYEWTQQHHGSISAEHGLGVMKAPYLSYSKSPSMITTMATLKRLFDPNNILNPYKCIPC